MLRARQIRMMNKRDPRLAKGAERWLGKSWEDFEKEQRARHDWGTKIAEFVGVVMTTLFIIVMLRLIL